MATTCFVLSRDLMFASQVTGGIQANGLTAKSVANASQIPTDQPCIVILDLTIPGLDIAAVVAELRENAGIRVVAVGPHVHEGKLQAATDAGCDRVISKGQASRDLAGILQSLQSGD